MGNGEWGMMTRVIDYEQQDHQRCDHRYKRVNAESERETEKHKREE